MNAYKTVAIMEINIEVEYIPDMEIVMSYGIRSMPAIVVKEKVISMGKVQSPQNILTLFTKLGCK